MELIVTFYFSICTKKYILHQASSLYLIITVLCMVVQWVQGLEYRIKLMTLIGEDHNRGQTDSLINKLKIKIVINDIKNCSIIKCR